VGPVKFGVDGLVSIKAALLVKEGSRCNIETEFNVEFLYRSLPTLNLSDLSRECSLNRAGVL